MRFLTKKTEKHFVGHVLLDLMAIKQISLKQQKLPKMILLFCLNTEDTRQTIFPK